MDLSSWITPFNESEVDAPHFGLDVNTLMDVCERRLELLGKMRDLLNHRHHLIHSINFSYQGTFPSIREDYILEIKDVDRRLAELQEKYFNLK